MITAEDLINVQTGSLIDGSLRRWWFSSNVDAPKQKEVGTQIE